MSSSESSFSNMVVEWTQIEVGTLVNLSPAQTKLKMAHFNQRKCVYFCRQDGWMDQGLRSEFNPNSVEEEDNRKNGLGSSGLESILSPSLKIPHTTHTQRFSTFFFISNLLLFLFMRKSNNDLKLFTRTEFPTVEEEN